LETSTVIIVTQYHNSCKRDFANGFEVPTHIGVGKQVKSIRLSQSLFAKIVCVYIYFSEIPRIFYAAAVHIEGLTGSLFASRINVTTP
jgi:hypothetical protein